MSRIRMEDVVLPPAPAHVLRRRRGIISELTIATALAGATFAVAAVLLLGGAVRNLQAGQLFSALILVLVLLALYLTIGVVLCAAFVNRLRFWGGAPLSDIVEAKANFVRRWLFSAPRLLTKLLFHRLTGTGAGSAAGPWN